MGRRIWALRELIRGVWCYLRGLSLSEVFCSTKLPRIGPCTMTYTHSCVLLLGAVLLSTSPLDIMMQCVYCRTSIKSSKNSTPSGFSGYGTSSRKRWKSMALTWWQRRNRRIKRSMICGINWTKICSKRLWSSIMKDANLSMPWHICSIGGRIKRMIRRSVGRCLKSAKIISSGCSKWSANSDPTPCSKYPPTPQTPPPAANSSSRARPKPDH